MASDEKERAELLEEVRALRRELAGTHSTEPSDGKVRYQSVVDNVIDGITVEGLDHYRGPIRHVPIEPVTCVSLVKSNQVMADSHHLSVVR